MNLKTKINELKKQELNKWENYLQFVKNPDNYKGVSHTISIGGSRRCNVRMLLETLDNDISYFLIINHFRLIVISRLLYYLHDIILFYFFVTVIFLFLFFVSDCDFSLAGLDRSNNKV